MLSVSARGRGGEGFGGGSGEWGVGGDGLLCWGRGNVRKLAVRMSCIALKSRDTQWQQISELLVWASIE